MTKKLFSLLLMLALVVGFVFADAPESWINNSISYSWAYNSELPLTSGSTDTLGYDFSWFAFPGSSSVGVATHLGFSFSLDANPAFSGMHAFMGPAFNTVLAGGVMGYAAIGPTYTLLGYDQGFGFVEQQLGIGLDIGSRFALAGSERWDLAIIVGAFGDVTLLRYVNATRKEGFSANARVYFGFSFGSALVFSGYGMLPPVLYYY
ncbi:MAG: hypothetical protein EOM68_15715 [Spirochaetia bacterium]|nr:hypothetical protein [Spirochaetia bacterium]